MATESQIAAGKRNGAAIRVSQKVQFAFTGTGTVKQQILLPQGAENISVKIETPTAISGTPTSAMFSLGTTDGGVDVVAAVDAKAQGHIANTIVAAFNNVAPAASINPTILYAQVVLTGGTAPAGTITAYVDFNMPNS